MGNRVMRWAISATLLLAGFPGLATAASFQDLGVGRAYGVSADGLTVVGYNQYGQAFRWTAVTGSQGLGTLDGSGSTAWGVSANGTVVVGESGHRAFRWTSAGGMVDIGYIDTGGWPPYRVAAYSVSAAGLAVVGEQDNAAFRWTSGGGMGWLGNLQGSVSQSAAWAISADGNVVVGACRTSSGWHGYRWTTGTGMELLTGLPGGTITDAYCVSADGSVIAAMGTTSEGQGVALRWIAGTGAVVMNCPPGDTLAPVAMSADGSVVVGEVYSAAGTEGFIWDAANGVRRVQDVIEGCGIDLSEWQLHSALGISADGLTIAGYGSSPSGVHEEAWVATIPEPASLSLLALGGLALLRRRSR